MDTDVLLGHLWNKMGRFRKGTLHNRRFLSERHPELQDLLARSAAGCSSGEFDARGLANIVHGAAKAGLLTFELGSKCRCRLWIRYSGCSSRRIAVSGSSCSYRRGGATL